jgi:hypothetical protein
MIDKNIDADNDNKSNSLLAMYTQGIPTEG